MCMREGGREEVHDYFRVSSESYSKLQLILFIGGYPLRPRLLRRVFLVSESCLSTVFGGLTGGSYKYINIRESGD
jgi:hypothetical protein